MKLLLVIDIADDVAEVYEDITVDYDLRGRPKEDGFYTESIKYVEDADVRPLPQKKDIYGKLTFDKMAEFIGYNACLEEIVGDINEGLQRCMGETE